MKDVTDLEVYNRSLILLEPICRLVSLLPKNEYETKSQLLNAAKSIAPLITEGFAKRRSQREFRRFLEMALGSSDEVITHIRVIKIVKYSNIKDKTCDALIGNYKIVSKQINSLIKTVTQNINNPESDI